MLERLFFRLKRWVHDESHFILPFLCVGTGGFVIDAGSLTLLVMLFAPQTVLHTLLLRCVGFSCGVLFTWFFNKNWTFRERPDGGSLLFYYPMMVVGALVNLGVFTACLVWLPLAARYPVVGVVVGTGTALFVNFASMRWLIFTKRS